MFKSIAVVAVAVVAQEQPLWEQPNIGPECNGDCVGMLKFSDQCKKADLTCLVTMCTDPETVKKCLTCAKAESNYKQFEEGCAKIKEAEKSGVTAIPTGTEADAVVASAMAEQSKEGGADASATPAASGASASGASGAASSAGSAAASLVSAASSAAAPAASQGSGAEKLAPAALVGAAGLLAALF